MSNQENLWNSLGVIHELTKRAPAGYFGRTALMKLIFFLQALRNVPLNYEFTLYNYGPFDSDVLDDIKYAQSLEMVDSKLVLYPSGYGYNISPENIGDEIKKRISHFVKDYENDISWVVNNFGEFNASELELLSTIQFMKRESNFRHTDISSEELVSQVNEIKPHFSPAQIKAKISYLDSLVA